MNNQRIGVEESASGSVGLLMSILVRYPEVSSIKYDPELREIRFAFMVGRLLSDAEFASFWEILRSNLDAYAFVTSRDDLPLDLVRKFADKYTVVEIARDVETLCQEEISLIIQLIHNAFGTDLLVDDADPMMDEEPDVQDGVIDQMLDDIKDFSKERKLIGFREEGRVMVFNHGAPSTD